MAQKADDAPLYVALGLLGMAAFLGVAGTLSGNKEKVHEAIDDASSGAGVGGGHDPTPPPAGLVANAVKRGRVGKRKRKRGATIVRKDAVVSKDQAFSTMGGKRRRKKAKGSIGAGTLNAGGTRGLIGGCGCGPKGKRRA